MKTEKTPLNKTRIRLKKNDLIEIIAGKDKGKQGKILNVNYERNRVYVEGVNLLTHYERPTQQNPKGGLSKKEGSIAASNVLLFCQKCDKGVRIRNVQTDEGVKNRVCCKCGDIL